MKSTLAILFVTFVVSGTVGCSMCCGPYDYDYPTYGGKHERADRAYGRVGSLFSDPYAGYNGESADSNLVNTQSTPTTSSSGNGEAERDIEKFRKEIDEQQMERIEPREKPATGGEGTLEQLPPPTDAGNDPTAMRPWRGRLLRGGQIYNR